MFDGGGPVWLGNELSCVMTIIISLSKLSLVTILAILMVWGMRLVFVMWAYLCLPSETKASGRC